MAETGIKKYGKNYRLYKLSDFSQETQNLAKSYLANIWSSGIRMIADEKAEECFDLLKDIKFGALDEITIDWSIKIVGLDVLSAIGIAEESLQKNQKNPLES